LRGKEESVVKKIEAIITPYILDAVRGVLNQRGCEEILLSEVRLSHHDSTSASGHYRGNTYDIDLPKIKLEAIVADDDAMSAAQAILHASECESSAQAKVSVCPLEQVVSIGVLTLEPGERSRFGEVEQVIPRRTSQGERLHA
jgi:nitrogen regulatory protein P-II 1